MIDHDEISTKNIPKSLVWNGDSLVDWVNGGHVYHLDGRFEHSGIGIGYKFDDIRTSPNGIYNVVFERLGTKGLVLKGSDIVREIDRSYYCASVYEFPIAIVELKDGRTCLIHCPNNYDTIEIEEIETGTKIGQSIKRDPDDFFQSRLQISETGKFLISAGWHWHPWGAVQYYNLDEAAIDNSKFDKTASILPINGEVCSARFISKSKLLVSLTSEPSLNDQLIDTKDQLFPMQIGIINLDTLKLEKKTKITQETGDLLPIDEDLAWCLYNHPKIINLNSGEILFEYKDLNTGQQNSSIIHHLDYVPTYAYDSENRRLAVATKKGISILTYYE